MAESKRQLAGALEQLMEQKPLDQVRVSEIVALASVSKQTFYHHFTDKYHLMEYCFRDMFSQQFDRMATLAPFGECYLDFLAQCRQRKTILRNGFTSQDVNSLYRVMHHALRDAMASACACTAWRMRVPWAFAWTFSRRAAPAARATGSIRAWISLTSSWSN